MHSNFSSNWQLSTKVFRMNVFNQLHTWQNPKADKADTDCFGDEIVPGDNYYRLEIGKNRSHDLKLSIHSMERFVYVLFTANPELEQLAQDLLQEKFKDLKTIINSLCRQTHDAEELKKCESYSIDYLLAKNHDEKINFDKMAVKNIPNTFTNLLAHIVFSTKNQKQIITDDFRGQLFAYVEGILIDEEAIPLAIGGTADHIHIAIKMRSTHVVSDLVDKIKMNSCSWLNENEFIENRFDWQKAYSVFSTSASQIEKLQYYIDNQTKAHKKRTFQDELIKMLQKHKIEYDPKHLWD